MNKLVLVLFVLICFTTFSSSKRGSFGRTGSRTDVNTGGNGHSGGNSYDNEGNEKTLAL